MPSQVIKDKIRKSNLAFKRGRANARRQNCTQTARKEAKEGKTHETGIGLNIDLNTMSSATASTLKDIESIAPQYTARPLANKSTTDENKFYNFLIFDTETNTTSPVR